jgi:hypothetical protein
MLMNSGFYEDKMPSLETSYQVCLQIKIRRFQGLKSFVNFGLRKDECAYLEFDQEGRLKEPEPINDQISAFDMLDFSTLEPHHRIGGS